jgi:DNA-binding PadR family transcriptional regulator
MLKLAALGLLQQEPMNGYRLKQQLEIFMSCCISVNYGAIYPLLKRLEEQSEVVLIDADAENISQSCKTYGITKLGQERWREEMLDHPQESWVNARSRFMIKFFFFSELQPQERIQLIAHRLMTCQLRLSSKLVGANSTDPHQVRVWQRSIDVIQSEIQWLNQQLTQEQSNLPTASSITAP